MVTDQSPTSPSNGAVDSPQSRRRNNLPSPWASIVRGDSEQIISAVDSEHSTVPSPPPPQEQESGVESSVVESSGGVEESADVNGESNVGGPARRPAWNRPVNGVVEPANVMGGAAVWPALSELTRTGPRGASLDATRPVSDGSVVATQAPIISQPPQRQPNPNAHANSHANNSTHARPRSRNRGGGGGSSSGSGPMQNTFTRPSAPMPPPFPVVEVPYGLVPPMLDAPVRGSRPAGGLGVSQSHTSNDHSSQRSAPRRGNFGPRPRGDGQYQNNHGGRRDQDRRDVHLPPPFLPPPMGYMPSPLPPGAGPFMAPPPMRVFPGHMGFDMPSHYFIPMPPESFRPIAMGPTPPPVPFLPANENTLSNSIVNQINYYFSEDNLARDNFLRSKMDNHGWVPISVIASFRRVQHLTNDITVILEALRYSTDVEVQGDKVRRRNEWNRWLPAADLQNNNSGSRSAEPENSLATSLQQVSLDGSSTIANGDMEVKEDRTEVTANISMPEESIGQSKLVNGEDTAEESLPSGV